MNRLLFNIISVLTFFLLCAFTIKQINWEECDECQYENTFDHTINGGEDSVYKLYCRKSGNSNTIYKRKNGKWERQGKDTQYEKCELVKFLCDCDK